MPYNEPKKIGRYWVLPKKYGGLHSSSKGKVVHFKSKALAERAARAIMANEKR